MEKMRTRDLFCGLWVPDLFMRRVEENGDWCLMCPHKSLGLEECWGEEFEALYTKYEKEGNFLKKVKAQKLWYAIFQSQMETGTPYILYKDSCNRKSNHQNIGTIKCNNLCTEIIQYSSPDEVLSPSVVEWQCLARIKWTPLPTAKTCALRPFYGRHTTTNMILRFQSSLWIFILLYQNALRYCNCAEPGYLDFDNLPETNFSCSGKVIGGYYADPETGCQMFHVCTIGQKGEVTDIKFLCLNGTVFDQETRVCERIDEVDCSKAEGFYNLNLELYAGNQPPFGFPEEEEEDDDGILTTSSPPTTTSTTASPTTPVSSMRPPSLPPPSPSPSPSSTTRQPSPFPPHSTSITFLQFPSSTSVSGQQQQPSAPHHQQHLQHEYEDYLDASGDSSSEYDDPATTEYHHSVFSNGHVGVLTPPHSVSSTTNSYFTGLEIPITPPPPPRRPSPSPLGPHSPSSTVKYFFSLNSHGNPYSHSHNIHLTPAPLNFEFSQNAQHVFTPTKIVSSTSSTFSVSTAQEQKKAQVNPLEINHGLHPFGANATVSRPAPPPSHSYDEYQESDVSSDPFFKDVPKLSRREKRQSRRPTPVPDAESILTPPQSTVNRGHGRGRGRFRAGTTTQPPEQGDVTPASRRANGRPSVVMDETAIAELPRRTGSRRIPASRSRTKANPRETTTASSARTTTIPIVTTTELPRTSFTCQGKTLGGYYADPEADCQLFHICSQGRHGRIQDNKFLCGPGTRFEQQSRICQERSKVDCSLSKGFYHLNNFRGDEETITVPSFEAHKEPRILIKPTQSTRDEVQKKRTSRTRNRRETESNQRQDGEFEYDIADDAVDTEDDEYYYDEEYVSNIKEEEKVVVGGRKSLHLDDVNSNNNNDTDINGTFEQQQQQQQQIHPHLAPGKPTKFDENVEDLMEIEIDPSSIILAPSSASATTKPAYHTTTTTTTIDDDVVEPTSGINAEPAAFPLETEEYRRPLVVDNESRETSDVQSALVNTLEKSNEYKTRTKQPSTTTEKVTRNDMVVVSGDVADEAYYYEEDYDDNTNSKINLPNFENYTDYVNDNYEPLVNASLFGDNDKPEPVDPHHHSKIKHISTTDSAIQSTTTTTIQLPEKTTFSTTTMTPISSTYSKNHSFDDNYDYYDEEFDDFPTFTTTTTTTSVPTTTSTTTTTTTSTHTTDNIVKNNFPEYDTNDIPLNIKRKKKTSTTTEKTPIKITTTTEEAPIKTTTTTTEEPPIKTTITTEEITIKTTTSTTEEVPLNTTTTYTTEEVPLKTTTTYTTEEVPLKTTIATSTDKVPITTMLEETITQVSSITTTTPISITTKTPGRRRRPLYSSTSTTRVPESSRHRLGLRSRGRRPNHTSKPTTSTTTTTTTSFPPITYTAVPKETEELLLSTEQEEKEQQVPVTTTTTTISPPTTTTTTLSLIQVSPNAKKSRKVGFSCAGLATRRYYSDPRDCRLFHYCSPGFHTRQVLDFKFACDDGTVFNEPSQRCELNKNICVVQKIN